MNKLFFIIFIFFLCPSILLGDTNIDWKKCLGKIDNSSSWSSKPNYCYNKENLKLFSEEEIKAKILEEEIKAKILEVDLIKNKIKKQIDYSKYKSVLFEDFSKKFKFKKIKKNIKKFEYFNPSGPYWKAFTNSMKIIDEEMIISIKPGTRQSDGNKRHGTERAEWGFYVVDGKKLIQRDKIIKLSYDFKLPANSSHLFINEKRVLISQVKFDGGKFPGFSPPFAFYVHKGGAATCVDYDNKRTSKKFQISNHTEIPKEINIYDGEWHRVEFIFKLGRGDGYCLIKIDGKQIIEKFNYDNDLDPNEQIVSRFGPYRDESKNTHIIYYDNIEVGYFD